MLTKNNIKFINNLSIKKFRLKNKLFVVEGEKIVYELLQSNFEIESLYATRKWLDENPKNDLINFHEVSNSELKKISNLSSPNNVLAIVKIKSFDTKINNFRGKNIILDQISDPGNLGTIIRLCDWFGVENIICSENTVDYLNPKVIQSSMGSLFRIKLFYTDLSLFLENIKHPVYSADLNGTDIKKSQIKENAFILFGNESSGVSSNLNQFISQKIKISSNREGVDSLNVACAASIFLYEYL